MKSLNDKKTVFICIGSDKHHYDCLGPLTGSLLKLNGYKYVYGELGDPVNSSNLDKYIKLINEKYNNDLVIAIDAAKTAKIENDGLVVFRKKGVKPGEGVGKDLPVVGDYSILYVVYKDKFDNSDGTSLGFAFDGAKAVLEKIKEIVNFREMSVMKKCKHCNCSEFGVILKETRTAPAIMSNDSVKKLLEDWAVTSQEIEINYCYGCEKNITKDDLISTEVCPLCNHEVDALTNNACSECNDKINSISSLLPNVPMAAIIALVNVNKNGEQSKEEEEVEVKDTNKSEVNKEEKVKKQRKRTVKKNKEPKVEENNPVANEVVVIDNKEPLIETKTIQHEEKINIDLQESAASISDEDLFNEIEQIDTTVLDKIGKDIVI